ncbi:MAG: hypothetical protein ABIK09_09365 [Pseudomonadota bacterium]
MIRLQQIDNELHRYQVQRDELAGKLGQLQELVARMENSLDEKRGKLGEVEAWYKDQVEAIRKDSERISKLKGSLGAVTKTKEYLLRQREIETLRKAKQAKEDELGKAEEAIEDFRQTIQEEEKRQDALRGETEEEGGEGWKQVKAIEALLSEIHERREAVIPELPKQIYNKYKRISKRREGLAVVPVLDGSCSGCQRHIRPQQYNILLRAETLEHCPSCTRVVYIPPDLAEAELNGETEEVEAEA